MAGEVGFAVVGAEEGSDRGVGVVGAEVAGAAVEAGDDAVGAFEFEDGAAGGGVAEGLGAAEVFVAGGGGAELAAVLAEVVVEGGAGAEGDVGAGDGGGVGWPRDVGG